MRASTLACTVGKLAPRRGSSVSGGGHAVKVGSDWRARARRGGYYAEARRVYMPASRKRDIFAQHKPLRPLRGRKSALTEPAKTSLRPLRGRKSAI